MKSIWQMWEAELGPSFCQDIINECELYKPQDAVVGIDDAKKVEKIRSSEVRWINADDENSRFIYNLIWKYGNLANREAFGVDLSTLHDVQYTIYDSADEGHYDWHFDTFWGNSTLSDRKLSVTIQLSESKDYEGGDFILDPQFEQPDPKKLRNQGTILVFPSTIRHKVNKVTKGTRKSLVAWIEGPKWK